MAKLYKPMGILLDIQLPVKSGWDVMDEIKKDSQTKHYHQTRYDDQFKHVLPPNETVRSIRPNVNSNRETVPCTRKTERTPSA